MMRRTLTTPLLAAGLMLAAPAQATLIAYWDFNDSTTDPTAGPASFATTFASGGINFFTGSGTNALPGVTTGQALATVNQANNGETVTFAVDTTGFQGITLSFASQRTATGFQNNQVAYSTDGGATFTDFGIPYTPATSFGTTVWAFNFSSVADLNDNPDAQFRITFNDATSAAGNNRLDNVQLQGTVTSAAPAAVLPGAGDSLVLDFQDYRGLGLSQRPVAGQLHSANWLIPSGGMQFGEERAGGAFGQAYSTGGITTGSIYAAIVGTDDYALGIQPTGSLFVGQPILLRLENTGGELIDTLQVSYDLLYFNDQARGNLLAAAFSTDGLNFTPLGSIESPQAADSDPQWVSTPFSHLLTDLGLTPGSFFYMAFTGGDVTGSGSRDEFAINNIVITQPAAPEPVIVPEPATAMLAMAGVGLLAARRRRSA